MAKLTLIDIANLEDQSSVVAAINSNNLAIETAMETVLSRDGTSPNIMAADLDMNSKQILNLPEPVSDTDVVRLIDLTEAVEDVSGPPGTAATISIGTVTTVDTEDSASVTNVGTSSEAIFDFEIPRGPAGSGDMFEAVYDPNEVEDDAFDMDNMVEGSNTKILTSAERTKLTSVVLGPVSAVTHRLVSFADTTGKLAEDSGVAVSTDDTLVSNSDAKLPTEKAVKTYVDSMAAGSTPEQFGAVGDGVTDDTTALIAWIADLSSNKITGSLNGLTYLISSTVAIPDDAVVCGPGKILATHAGIALSITGDRVQLRDFELELDAYNSAVYTNGNRGVVAYSFSLPAGSLPVTAAFSDLVIDGLRINGFRESGIYIGYVTGFQITNNVITNCGRNGILGVSCTEGHVYHNTIDTLNPGQVVSAAVTLAYGITFSRAHSSPICRTAEAPCSKNIIIDSNIIRNNVFYVGIDTHGGHDIVISNNKIERVRFGISLEHASMPGTSGATGSTTTIHLGSNAIGVDDYYNGCTIILTGGTGAGVSRTISDYVGSTKVATVSSTFGATPDTTTTFVMWEPSGEGLLGVTARNISITGNNLSGYPSGTLTECGIAIDAQSGAGEISKGITISGNMIHAHGIPLADSIYSVNNAAIYAANVDSLVINGNVFRSCYGRAVCLSSKVRAASIVGNTVQELASITYTGPVTINNAFEIVGSDSSATFSGNTLISTSSIRMFALVDPDSTNAGAHVDQSNTVIGGATMWQTSARSRARGGSAVMGASLALCWDSSGTIQWAKVNRLSLAVSAATVTSGGTGIWTIAVPSGLFENARVASFYSASDASSGEVMTSTVSASSSSSITCKSRNTSGTAVDCSDNFLMVYGI